MQKKPKINWIVMVGHNCLVLTILLVILSLSYNFIQTINNDYIEAIIFVMLGIGSIMIYIPIGIKLEEIRSRYGKSI